MGDSETGLSNFLKNNIIGILIFSIVTGVLGNYIYDYLKEKNKSIPPTENKPKEPEVYNPPPTTNIPKAVHQPVTFPDEKKPPVNKSNPSVEISLSNTVTDNEGNTYKIRNLVGRTWLAQNLNLYVPNSNCNQDDLKNCETNGKLYQWEAAKLACKKLGHGWRLPSDAEWKELIMYFGGYSESDSKFKYQDIGNPEKSYKALSMGGISLFNAPISAGARVHRGEIIGRDWQYVQKELTVFWTNTEEDFGKAYAYYFQDGKIYRGGGVMKWGFSCRCIKD